MTLCLTCDVLKDPLFGQKMQQLLTETKVVAVYLRQFAEVPDIVNFQALHEIA